MWTGTKVHGPRNMVYGSFSDKGRKVLAHRWIYQETTGAKLLKGVVIRHTCDVSLCVNPDHLLSGTQADNIQDCIERGRAWWQKKA